jgi:hypothetical protein
MIFPQTCPHRLTTYFKSNLFVVPPSSPRSAVSGYSFPRGILWSIMIGKHEIYRSFPKKKLSIRTKSEWAVFFWETFIIILRVTSLKRAMYVAISNLNVGVAIADLPVSVGNHRRLLSSNNRD